MTTAPVTPLDPNTLAASEGARVHPIVHAGKWIAADLFSTLLFVGLYAATRSVYLATGLAIVAGVAQIAWLKLRGSTIDAMQWMSLGLVVVFGGASLITHDPRFIMLKPTLIYAALGVVMLRPGWIVRYQPPVALRWSRDVAMAFGYVWAGLMFASAALNLVLALSLDPKTWAAAMSGWGLFSKIGLFLIQYAWMTAVGRRRAAAAGVPAT